MSTCSVIIPVRNCERFIAQAIESLLVQTSPPTEIIVVNDGSTDGTAEILTRFKNTVHVITTKGLGAGCARNTGVDAAQGEFVAFLDSDDIAHPQRLEKQIALLEADSAAGMVFCAMSYIDQHGRQTGAEIRCPEYRRSGFLGRLFERNRIGSTSTTMLRKSVFDGIGGFDEAVAYNEEYDLWLRLGRKWGIAYLDEPLLHYRLHSENISRSQEGQRINELIALRKHSTKEIFDALKKTYPDSQKARLALGRVLFRMEKTGESLAILLRLSATGCNDPLLYFLLGNIYMLQDKRNDAASAFEKCILLSPECAEAYNNLGVVYCRNARVDEALTAFKTAISLKQHYADPAHNVACLNNHLYSEVKYTLPPLRKVLKPSN